MPRPEVAIQPTRQDLPIRSWKGDWVVIVLADPNGPLLGIMGQIDGWDDEGVFVNEYETVRKIPYNTIEYCHAIDGPVTGPIEWDPDRPT